MLRQLLDVQELRALLAETETEFGELEKRREFLSAADLAHLNRMEMPVPGGKSGFRTRLENYRAVASTALIDVLERAAGPFVWHFPPMIRRVGPASEAGFVPYHQDWPYASYYPRFFTCWVPLTRCGRDAPGLEIITESTPRSYPHVSIGSWEHGISPAVLEPQLQGRAAYAPELDPGDVVVFNEHCLHRTYHLPTMTLTRTNIDVRAAVLSDIPADIRRRRKFVNPRTVQHVDF